MKRKQLAPCLLFTGAAGVLIVMPNLADVVQVTGVLRNHCTTDIEVERDDTASAKLTARKVK